MMNRHKNRVLIAAFAVALTAAGGAASAPTALGASPADTRWDSVPVTAALATDPNWDAEPSNARTAS